MTGRTIFERALSLCDLRGAGAALPADLADLEVRGLDFLNVLIAENVMLDRRLTGEVRPLQEVASLEETVALSEKLCALLAYGMASLLMAEEDPSLCGILDARYRAARNALLADGKSRVHAIREDC